MKVVIGEVEILQRTVLDYYVDELIHVIASHTIPTYVKLLQVSRASQ